MTEPFCGTCELGFVDEDGVDSTLDSLDSSSVMREVAASSDTRRDVLV